MCVIDNADEDLRESKVQLSEAAPAFNYQTIPSSDRPIGGKGLASYQWTFSFRNALRKDTTSD